MRHLRHYKRFYTKTFSGDNCEQKMTLDWAMKEFNAADEEDRAGLADQGTARTFYAGEISQGRPYFDRSRGARVKMLVKMSQTIFYARM